MSDRDRTMSEEQIHEFLQTMVDSWQHPLRSPILATPADVGLEFEDVVFPAQDGVALEGWFIPRPGSQRLVIANHPLMFNRYGCPSHREPWRSVGAGGGNTFEVNYVPDYRILHDAGYNVLAYDERGHGRSAEGNGLNSGGRCESRDVIGSLLYARSRDDLAGMAIGLFSRCQGANATLFAMHDQPAHFADVRCLVAAQPLSVGVVMHRDLERVGLGERLSALDDRIRRAVGLGFDEMSPVTWAPSVSVPTLIYQVHDDLMTRPDDAQAVFDAIPTPEKKLHWITGTTARWDGYLEFQRRPQPMLAWLANHLT